MLGEFTIAYLLLYTNLQVTLFFVSRGTPNAGVLFSTSSAALLFAFVLLLILSYVGRRARTRRSPRGPRVPSQVTGVEVSLRGLHRRYGQVVALDGLDLTLAPGELVALLGPSGCGKTTTLRLLAGLEDADGGQVVVDGTDITHVPANKRDMGMVFQAYSLFPHMTVRDNVAFGLRLRGGSHRTRSERARSRCSSWSASPTQAGRYAHQLSGGQQQRVALARALAIQPKVLLLDEPLSALDAKVRAQLRDEIRRIQLEVGITTLFVTHDQEEALAIADRVGVMRDGQHRAARHAHRHLLRGRPPRSWRSSSA